MSRIQGSGRRQGLLASALLASALLAAWGCGNGDESGTGGSGGPQLVIDQVLASGAPLSAKKTFLAPSEQLTIRAHVSGVPEPPTIHWNVTPANPQTGPATLLGPAEGPELAFEAKSLVGRDGSREPNPALEYDVAATVVIGGMPMEAHLPAKAPLRQAEVDVLRQEYQDYGTSFQPALANVAPPENARFNTGNYTVIAEGRPGGLQDLSNRVSQRANALLNNDIQAQPVGTRGLAATAVVVSPGAAIRNVGALGDTDPQGDDVCAGPTVKGKCAGSVLAGPNGIAETSANNRGTKVDLEATVTSAFRNPQRNTAAGSKALNSLHTVGLALDLDPRVIDVPGKSSDQLMCVLEQAGDDALGQEGVSFTEHGATTFLECNNPQADHVHVNFNFP